MRRNLSEILHGQMLTPREAELLGLASRGFTAKESAQHIGVSVETVRTQRKIIIAKLGARNMCHAVTEGFRRGILHL